MNTLNLFHVDVFSAGPLSGNGLCVFLHTEGWSASSMQRLTQEMKQFESIFLAEISPSGASARIFTVEEELPFAGHPVLGAAAVLHHTQTPEAAEGTWRLRLAIGEVAASTTKIGTHYRAEMNQGVALIGDTIVGERLLPILDRLSLSAHDLVPGADPQVISTGLPYLIVPVRADALARAAIEGADLETQLAELGAKFVLLLDVEGRELRNWDNHGRVEDVATGSAAGPVGAYLFGHGLADPALPIELAQGRFAGRPSTLTVRRDGNDNLLVSNQTMGDLRRLPYCSVISPVRAVAHSRVRSAPTQSVASDVKSRIGHAGPWRPPCKRRRRGVRQA